MKVSDQLMFWLLYPWRETLHSIG